MRCWREGHSGCSQSEQDVPLPWKLTVSSKGRGGGAGLPLKGGGPEGGGLAAPPPPVGGRVFRVAEMNFW